MKKCIDNNYYHLISILLYCSVLYVPTPVVCTLNNPSHSHVFLGNLLLFSPLWSHPLICRSFFSFHSPIFAICLQLPAAPTPPALSFLSPSLPSELFLSPRTTFYSLFSSTHLSIAVTWLSARTQSPLPPLLSKWQIFLWLFGKPNYLEERNATCLHCFLEFHCVHVLQLVGLSVNLQCIFLLVHIFGVHLCVCECVRVCMRASDYENR